MRRLKSPEDYHTKLAALAASDVALMIYGFQGIFAVLGFLCLILAVQDFVFAVPNPYVIEVRQILKLILWLLPALVCAGFFWMLQNESDYPKSIEKVEKKIEKLKSRLPKTDRN
jgi:hypothetical protein